MRILIPERIPSLNKGEMAILEGILRIFEPLAPSRVSILTTAPEVDEHRYPPHVRPIAFGEFALLNVADKLPKILALRLVISLMIIAQHVAFSILFRILGRRAMRLMKSRIWQEYCECDVIVMGHDGQFGIGGGPFEPIMLYPLFMPLFARMIDKPVIMLGASVKRVERHGKLVEYMESMAISNMNLATFRERSSYLSAVRMSPNRGNILHSPDPAFFMKPSSESILPAMILADMIPTPSLIIGVTVAKEVAQKAFRQFSKSRSYELHNEIMATTVDMLISRLGALIVFIPHCIGDGDDLDDRIVARDIISHTRSERGILTIEEELSASQLKTLIENVDILIGERIHSVIGALSTNTLGLALSFPEDVRLEIVYDSVGSISILTTDELTPDVVLERVRSILERSDELTETMARKNSDYEEMLHRDQSLLRKILQPDDDSNPFP